MARSRIQTPTIFVQHRQQFCDQNKQDPHDTITGATTSVVTEPIPLGKRASRASQWETVRVEENVSVNCLYDVASGGRVSDVIPSFFIITFCACTAGFVARWHDFFASLSLRLIEKVCRGYRECHLGGEVCSTSAGASLQTAFAKLATASLASKLTSCAKLATVSFTCTVVSEKRCSGSVCRVPRVTVILRREGEEQGACTGP